MLQSKTIYLNDTTKKDDNTVISFAYTVLGVAHGSVAFFALSLAALIPGQAIPFLLITLAAALMSYWFLLLKDGLEQEKKPFYSKKGGLHFFRVGRYGATFYRTKK